MNIATAAQHIRSCCERMEALYHKPVFNEWVVLSLLAGKARVLAYDGPRSETFEAQIHRDSAPLFAEMQGRQYGPGDFEFVGEAKGSTFDACICVADNTYLFCNNTFGTLDQLRHDARWREAQKPFVGLTEKFRVDPLASDASS